MRRSPYNLGYDHGRLGVRHLAHRKLRVYDSASANRSYNHGYSDGYRARAAAGLRPGLDYSNPLNNQLFMRPDNG